MRSLLLSVRLKFLTWVCRVTGADNVGETAIYALVSEGNRLAKKQGPWEVRPEYVGKTCDTCAITRRSFEAGVSSSGSTIITKYNPAGSCAECCQKVATNA